MAQVPRSWNTSILLRTSSREDRGLAMGVEARLTSVELRLSSVASSGGMSHSTRPVMSATVLQCPESLSSTCARIVTQSRPGKIMISWAS